MWLSSVPNLFANIFTIFFKQAGAELCQAQSSLQLNLASYKLSSLQLKSNIEQKKCWFKKNRRDEQKKSGRVTPKVVEVEAHPTPKIVGLKLFVSSYI